MAAGVASTGVRTAAGLGRALRDSEPEARKAQEVSESFHASLEIVGDDAIAFRKHTLDLGACEAVCVVDMNRDGRLDVVSGENWYEQLAQGSSQGPRFIKHKFRDIPYTAPYLEDLGDLVIDVNGDGYPDLVTCSVWSKPLSWWENPGDSNTPWVAGPDN
jgi:hypothetical protein